MTREIFRTYISRVLGPTLKRGDIVVMDNVPLHRTHGVREALEALGVSVPKFPAYSPDINAIEQPIGKLKASLCKLAPRLLGSSTAGFRKALQQFSPTECTAYLRHAVYGQPKWSLLQIHHDGLRNRHFVDMLRHYDVALVCADSVDWPRLMDVNSDFVYCRPHGSEELYASGYGDKALDARPTAWRPGRVAASRTTLNAPGRKRADADTTYSCTSTMA